VGTDEQFAALARTLGEPRLADAAAYATNAARVANRAELRRVLERRLAEAPVARWVHALTAAGVPAGEVNDIAAAFALAEELGLEPTVSLARPDGTAVRLARNPLRLSATPTSYRAAPPALGGAQGA